jgi:GDSL family lipase
MIFKQIWNTSAEKKKESSTDTVEIDINKGSTDSTSDVPPSSEQSPSSTENSSENIDAHEVTSAPDVTFYLPTDTSAKFNGYVKSDYSYFDNALFIGDSRTVGLRDYGSLNNSAFYCDVGLTTSDANSAAESGTLADMLVSNQYGKVYIMLGINEVGNNFDSTMNNYSSLVQNILNKSPNSIIYLGANLHVTKEAQTEAISNQRIDELNTRISTLADNQSIFYIDINPVFDDDDGNLMAECTSDGVHVYAKYYPQWCDWFCMNTVPVE